jgi:hypothetical protein
LAHFTNQSLSKAWRFNYFYLINSQ